jgi:hypothetical protein
LLADTPQKPNHIEKEFLHMKSLFEQLGGTYHEENGVTYTNLLTSGRRLNAYLVDIGRQAQECFERLIEGMKQAQGKRNA